MNGKKAKRLRRIALQSNMRLVHTVTKEVIPMNFKQRYKAIKKAEK